MFGRLFEQFPFALGRPPPEQTQRPPLPLIMAAEVGMLLRARARTLREDPSEAGGELDDGASLVRGPVRAPSSHTADLGRVDVDGMPFFRLRLCSQSRCLRARPDS